MRALIAMFAIACAASEPAVEELGTESHECAECHQDHFDEWSRSRHASAFVGELFQREWSIERAAFCLGCHAPRVEDPELPNHDEAARGVDCASCHVVDGVVRATRVSGEAPHESRVDPELGTTDACAPCHQVDFPHQPGLPLQDTVHEWRAADEPAGACQTCHMSAANEWHRHDFVGGHDPAWIADALRIETELVHRGERTTLIVTLHNEGAGHAIPTGDVFRRLAVRAWPTRADYIVRERELGRHFDARDGRWEPIDDDRVLPGEAQRIELEFPRRVDEVQWYVEMRSVPRALADGTIEARHAPRRVAEGVIE